MSAAIQVKYVQEVDQKFISTKISQENQHPRRSDVPIQVFHPKKEKEQFSPKKKKELARVP